MDKCGEGEEMWLGAVCNFEAQSSGKEDNDISVHTWGTRRLGRTTRMGGWGSGGQSLLPHKQLGKECEWDLGEMKTEIGLGQMAGKEQKQQAGE